MTSNARQDYLSKAIREVDEKCLCCGRYGNLQACHFFPRAVVDAHGSPAGEQVRAGTKMYDCERHTVINALGMCPDCHTTMDAFLWRPTMVDDVWCVGMADDAETYLDPSKYARKGQQLLFNRPERMMPPREFGVTYDSVLFEPIVNARIQSRKKNAAEAAAKAALQKAAQLKPRGKFKTVDPADPAASAAAAAEVARLQAVSEAATASFQSALRLCSHIPAKLVERGIGVKPVAVEGRGAAAGGGAGGATATGEAVGGAGTSGVA